MSRAMWSVALVLLALISLLAACGGDDQASPVTRLGPGMMGITGTGEPVRDLADARREAERFAAGLDLRVGEVMQFSNGYYAELLEQGGAKATEVLVDPRVGAVWIEYGPAMMWNTRYGMMDGYVMRGAQMMGGSGMMGGQGWGMMGSGFRGDPTWMPSRVPSAAPAIPAKEAEAIAGRWLEENATGLTAGEAEAFPGYYTLHTLRGEKVEGMLSVNADTGAVWYHWWHGRFVAMKE